MDEMTAMIWVATAGLLVAALGLLRFAWGQRSHRGSRLWVTALLLSATAMAIGALASDLGLSESVGGAVHAALLAWPVLTLTGLRRFHARLGLLGSEPLDWTVLGSCILAALVSNAWAAGADSALVIAVVTPLPHLYAGALLWLSTAHEDAGALRLLGSCILLSALPPMVAPDPMVAQMLCAAFGLTVLAFTVLIMMSERTERELRESRRRLRVLANTDPLTGVPNRRRFNELVARSMRDHGEEPALMLMFDLDYFKLINDRLGHAAGDRALRLVGRCMNEALRARDLAGRLGGDEFALLLRGASIEQSIVVASRIVSQLQTLSPAHHLPCLCLSFGIARVHRGETADDTLRRADQALYEAKRQGRSRAVTAEGNEAHPVFSESRRLGLVPI